MIRGLGKFVAARKLKIAVMAGALIAVGGPVSAFADSFVSYDATSQYVVTDIAVFQKAPDEDSITYSFTINVGETVIHNPFAVGDIPDNDFLLGVATNLASDNGDGQQHLVIFSNVAFAASAQNIAFGTLFPNTTEESLLNDLEAISQNVPGNAAINDLYAFSDGDALSGPNGSIKFAIGDPFSEIAFSNGQIIGSGTSLATPAGVVAAAPEPSAWLLMIAGVGGIGLMLRQVRRKAIRTVLAR